MSVCYPIRTLKHEYRKLTVKNYTMIYRVDESAKLKTIARVVYAKSDYGNCPNKHWTKFYKGVIIQIESESGFDRSA